MQSITIKAILVGCLSIISAVAGGQDSNQHDTQQARLLSKRLASDLSAELTSAMTAHGPTGGIEACSIKAPQIADEIAAESGWLIGRTSLKVRNPNNSPDEWEQAVLNQFELRHAGKENVNNLEYSERVTVGDKTIFRYMKAIPTKGLCLACHGSNLNDEVANKVNSLYPNDRATGFNLDDIRGAFTLTKISQN